MSVTIKSIGGRDLYVAESAGDVRAAVVEAVKARADLYGANLSRADLPGADLYGANLPGADLYGADLSRANLSGADLYGADLSRANLTRADLSGANLPRANLYGANLSRANLTRADLYGAYLYGANLSGANLYGADLSRADLPGADLYGADHAEAALAQTVVCPEGDIIGWKKCQGGRLVKLLIPSDAKRSNASGRKCRAEYAKVLAILDGNESVDEARSQHNPGFIYRVGEMVHPDAFDEDRWNECAPGIHFYITRAEAEAH